MSSGTYSTELTPEPWLRRLVLLSGCALAVLGLLAILTVSTPFVYRLPAGLAWLLVCSREIRRTARASMAYRRIRLSAGGGTMLESHDGSWLAATLAQGSVVLGRVAWLRITAPDGSTVVELLRGRRRENEDWRRLQVIWRHLGTAT